MIFIMKEEIMNGVFNFLCTDFLEIQLFDSTSYESGRVYSFDKTSLPLDVEIGSRDEDGKIVSKTIQFINRYTRYNIYLEDGRQFLNAKIKDINFNNRLVIETPTTKEKEINIFTISRIVNIGLVVERQKHHAPSHLEITVKSLGEEKLIVCYLVGIACIKNCGMQLIVVDKEDTTDKEIYISTSDIIQIKKKRG